MFVIFVIIFLRAKAIKPLRHKGEAVTEIEIKEEKAIKEKNSKRQKITADITFAFLKIVIDRKARKPEESTTGKKWERGSC